MDTTQTHNQNIIRIDFIFSYWIFLWYIFYILSIVKYNPKFALSIALFFNTLQIGLMIYYKNSLTLILLFSFVTFLIKGIPLWSLRQTPYEMKQVGYTIILYGVYSLWLWINNTTPYRFMMNTYNQTKNNKPFGPLTLFLQRFY